LATEQGTSIGKTVTLLMIFAITVVAIVIIFALFNGLFKFVDAGTGSASISGVFALGSAGSTSGTLAFQVTDTSTNPIVGITLSCPVAQFASASCGGLQMNYNTTLVSSTNPLPKGGIATGTDKVQSAYGTSFSAGTIYPITVNITFADGSTLSKTTSVAAQA
jgi:hypothetical protein